MVTLKYKIKKKWTLRMNIKANDTAKYKLWDNVLKSGKN